MVDPLKIQPTVTIVGVCTIVGGKRNKQENHQVIQPKVMVIQQVNQALVVMDNQ